MPAPYSPTLGAPFPKGLDAQGSQLSRACMWNLTTSLTTAYGATPPDGAMGYRTDAVATQDTGTSASTKKHLIYFDGTSDVTIPRSDCVETIISPWAFNRTGDAPPFTCNQALSGVGSTNSMVTNLNANYLQGYVTASGAATVDTIALRDSSGRVKVADPAADTDAVNLRYMRAELRNADDKGSVRVSTIVSLSLAGGYTFSANVITAVSNGTIPTQDGVTLVAGDLVAVMYEGGAGNQYYLGTAHNLNGIYVVTATGSAGAQAVLTRHSNFNVTSEVSAGAFFFVSEGTNQSNSKWALITDDPIYLRTDAPNGGSATPAAGGTLSANTYYYRVTFLDYSGAENATTLEFSGTTAAGNLTLNLAWNSYVEASSYKIYRSTVAGTYGATSYVGTTTSTTFSDTGIALTSGTPPTASTLQFAKIGSNSFYSAGNGINISGSVISVLIEGSTTYVANRILFNGSTTTIDSDANLTWNGSTMTVTGALTVTGATTLATSLTGVLKGASGVISAMTGAANRVTFWSDANTLSSSSAFTWDSVNLGLTAGILFVGAQTIQTSTGVLTLATGGGNADITINPHGTGNTNIQGYGIFSENVGSLGNIPSGYGISLGYNKSAGDAEANLIFGAHFNTSQYLEIGCYDDDTGPTYTSLWRFLGTRELRAVGAASITTSSGILTVTGTGGLTLTSSTSNTLLTQNSVNVFTSEGTGAIVNTLYLKAGNVGIGTTNPTENLVVTTASNADVKATITAGGTTKYAVLKLINTYGTANEKIWDILSNGDTGTFQIRAANDAYNAATAAITITRSGATPGHVGIGTTAPVNRVAILDSGTLVSFVANTVLGIQASSVAGTHAYVNVISGTSGTAGLAFGDTGNSAMGWIEYDNANNFLYLGSNAVKAAMFDTTQACYLYGTTNYIDAAAASAVWIFRRCNTSLAAPSNVADGEIVGQLEGVPYSAGYFSSWAKIRFTVDGTFTSGQRPPSRIEFMTNAANTASSIKMGLSSAGVLSLNNSSYTASKALVLDSSKNLVSSGVAIPAVGANTSVGVGIVVKTVLTAAMISGNTATQTHNLGTAQVNSQVQKVSTGQKWYPNLTSAANTVAVDFGFAPGDGEFEIITVG